MPETRSRAAVVLIPWRDSGDDRRRQLWDWTRPLLEEIGWPVFTGDDGLEPFSRAAAINAAAKAAGDWDVALVGDADTVQQVSAAHEAAALAPTAGLVVPWTHRIKLSQAGTLIVAQRGPNAVTEQDRDKRDSTAPWGGGGTIMVSRAAFEAVAGFDERFRGYGNEDLAFKVAVETMLIGQGAPRVAGLIWHLWHKTQPKVGTKYAATAANQERWNRYKAARWNPDAMREVLKR